MIDSCSMMPQGAGFISSVSGYVDCQAQILGSGPWQALAMSGSTLSVMLTGFLTIFIALIGYNLLLGSGMTIRGGVLAFVKIGAVFALATSWPAYRILVHDVVVEGPGQLVSEIGLQAGAVGSDGTLLRRLDLTDHAMTQLAILGVGDPTATDVAQVPAPPVGGFDAFMLGGSRLVFSLTAIASLAAVHIITGLMLALGPFFIAFLLFDNTRSLFEGWVRVLGGTALATIGASLVLGLELALLEPWLSTVIARRMSGEPMPTVSTELFVIVSLFAITVAAALFACARVARAFRLSPLLRIQAENVRIAQTIRAVSSEGTTRRLSSAVTERSRSAAVASALATRIQRERGESAFPEVGAMWAGRAPEIRSPASDTLHRTMPLGRTYRRGPESRFSGNAAKRDTRT